MRRAVASRIEEAGRAREDAALARLVEAFAGGPGRAASGLPEVLAAVHEQRVEILLVEAGFAEPGARCPTCGWLGAGGLAACPADGSATEPVGDLVEAAVERALTQAADVRVLRDRAELASHGRIAAVLRFYGPSATPRAAGAGSGSRRAPPWPAAARRRGPRRR